MNLEKKHIIILASVIFALLILLLLIYFIFLTKEKDTQPANQKQENQSGVLPNNDVKFVNDKKPVNKDEIKTIINNENITDAQIKKEASSQESQEKKSDALSQMALSFVERFGSYSNQSNFNNMDDLKIFMTEKMRLWTENYTNEKKAEQKNTDVYYGITTKAIFEEVLEFDEEKGIARILIKTRRREAQETTDNFSKTFEQDIEVAFLKENDIWLVDGAYWK